jgi:hypothetical protein
VRNGTEGSDRRYRPGDMTGHQSPATSRIKSAEFGMCTKSAVFLSRPKAFLQDNSYDTCTHFQLPGTHGVREGLNRVCADIGSKPADSCQPWFCQISASPEASQSEQTRRKLREHRKSVLLAFAKIT